MLLFLSFTLSAQAYQTYSMHFVRIEGDLKAFETVQQMYMQKVAQNAVDNGDIVFWAFLRRVTMDNIDDEERKNYLFVQSNTDVATILSDKNEWWNNANSILSKEEQAIVDALSSKFTLVSDLRHIFQDEVSVIKGLGTHVKFNFASPKNLAVFTALK